MLNKISQLKTEIAVHDFLTKPRAPVLLLPVFENEWPDAINTIDQLVRKKLSEKAKNTHFKAKKGDCLIFSDASFIYQEVVIFGLGKRSEFHFSLFQRYLADVLRGVASRKFASAAFLVSETFGESLFELGKFLSEAYYLSQYQFDRYKSEEEREKIHRIEKMFFYFDKSPSERDPASRDKIQNPDIKSNPKSKIINPKQFIEEFKKGLDFGKIVAQGVCLVRDLVNEPASHLYPKTLSAIACTIARESAGAITCQVLDQKQCAKVGMGAFLGVAKGSDHEPQFIILKYKKDSSDSTNKKSKSICLIGKSITFDSGGLSLKPSEAMETMKIDMAGGATVLGFFYTLSHLHAQQLFSPSCTIYGILPACENMPSGKAMRPGDIVKALNGKTIEVANTDAEGRLILADALSYAEKYLHPEYIVDLATLTGAIMIALGDEITGLFGNHKDFTAQVLQSARKEGESIWEMPLYADYLTHMKSFVADIKNVSSKRYGGAITAGLFLQAFVSNHTKWAHLDIAGASYNEGGVKGMREKGATGWGVKTLMRLIYDCTKSL